MDGIWPKEIKEKSLLGEGHSRSKGQMWMKAGRQRDSSHDNRSGLAPAQDT